jgi:hypothetical protein
VFVPIDLAWAERSFPSIFQVFGAEFPRQIEIYNGIVRERQFDPSDGAMLFAMMYREGARPEPHGPLLRSLSMLQAPAVNRPTTTGWLVHLENLLADALGSGIGPNVYSGMLRSSDSFFDLIAELEWGTSLRRLSPDFRPHELTTPGQNRNYDINWRRDPFRIVGDVKFFKNWLIRRRGINVLTAVLQLLRFDIAHLLFVSMDERELGEDMAIRAALELMEMYRAGLAQETREPFVVAREGDHVVVVNNFANRYINRIRFDPSVVQAGGEPRIVLTESGFSSDAATIRAAILRAAPQIPDPAEDEISCVFLGSASPTDADEVEDVAFGQWVFDRRTHQAVHRNDGVLAPEPPEADFRHLQSIIHFAIWLDDDHAGDPQVARIYRRCRLLEKDGALSEDKRAFLAEIIRNFELPDAVRVEPRRP